MAKEPDVDEVLSKKLMMQKGMATGTGPGYKKRRFGLLSDEVDAKIDIYDKEGKISKSSGVK